MRSPPKGYSAWAAQLNYEKRRRRSCQRKKLKRSSLQKYVIEKLQVGWSPEQISGKMRLEGKKDRVCKETIYAWLYEDE